MVRREYGRKDDRLTGSVDRIALARAIKDLPAGYRTIFLLHEIEGYEHQEIAQLLDCSVGNSKSQLHKAKLRIRELLGYARAEAQDGAKQPETARQRSARSRAEYQELSPALVLEAWEQAADAEEPQEAVAVVSAVNAAAPQFIGSNA
jgi:hypothetical protein